MDLRSQGLASIDTKSPIPRSTSSRWVDLFDFYKDVDTAITSRYQELGPIFRWTTIKDTVMLLGPDANQFVLTTHPKIFAASLGWSDYIGALFRGGLLNRDGSDHRQHRKLLTPAFRQEALRGYLEQIEFIIQEHFEKMPAHCPNIYDEMKMLTLHIASRAFFGVTDPEELKVWKRLITDVVAGSVAFVKWPIIGRTYRKALASRKQLSDLMRYRVEHRRRTPSNDMLGQLCQVHEDGEKLSDDEIIDQMIFLLMAAHDTTASTLTSIFFELAQHPEWQDRLAEESLDPRLARVAVGDLPEKLQAHHLVIKETLRRNTPLRIYPRVNREAIQYLGYTIKAKQLVAVCPAFSHFMEEYWTRPLAFDPERFAPDRLEHKRHPGLYVPFGGGLHLCLGQVFAEKFVAVILHECIKRYSWSIPNLDQRSFQKIPIQVPKGKLPVNFQRRKAQIQTKTEKQAS